MNEDSLNKIYACRKLVEGLVKTECNNEVFLIALEIVTPTYRQHWDILQRSFKKNE